MTKCIATLFAYLVFSLTAVAQLKQSNITADSLTRKRSSNSAVSDSATLLPFFYTFDTSRIYCLYKLRSSSGKHDSLIVKNDSITIYEVKIEKKLQSNQIAKLGDSIRLRYCRRSDLWIYDSLKQGKSITKTYIEFLDLHMLVQNDSKSNDLIINYPLWFQRCVIVNMGLSQGFERWWNLETAPDEAASKKYGKLIFNQPFAISHCVMPKIFYLPNCVFKKYFYFTNNKVTDFNVEANIVNCTFEGNFYYYNSDASPEVNKIRTHYEAAIQSGLIRELYFRDLPVSINIIYRPFKIRGNRFLSNAFIFNQDTTNSLVAHDNTFEGNVGLYDYFYTRRWFKIKKESKTYFPYRYDMLHSIEFTSVKNIDFGNSKFYGSIDMENTSLINVSFNACSFYNDLLMNNTILTKEVLSNSFFLSKNRNKVFTTLGNIDSLFSSYSIFDNISFPFQQNSRQSRYSAASLQQCRDFHLRLIDYFRNKFQTNPEAANELIERTKHDLRVYEIKYYWHNAKLIKFLWFGFLELVYKSGYHGEGSFFLSMLILILIFATVYYLKFKPDVLGYLSGMKEKQSDPKPIKERNELINIAKSIWLSFYIFINPRFPLAFFNFNKSMFKWLIIEWCLGLFMIILYFIFLASKYPFIQQLFGL